MVRKTVLKNNSIINVGSNACYSIFGNNDLILVGSGSAVAAIGSALRVKASGAGDVVSIGGNGRYACDANVDFVTFQAAGTLAVLTNSRVGFYGSNSAITLAGCDNVGVFGSGDVVWANGTGNSVWIGQNGQNATGAAIDVVHGLNWGALLEFQYSNVAVDGSNYTATMTGWDTLTATGNGVRVNASGTENVLNIGGAGGVATLANGGVVNVLSNSTTSVAGNGVTVDVAEPVNGASHVCVTGAGDQVNVTGAGHHIVVGQNSAGGAADTVTFLPGVANPSEVVVPFGYVTELAHSNLSVAGGGVAISLSGYDTLTVQKGGYTIDDGASDIGGNVIFLGNNRIYRQLYAADVVTLRNKGESVVLSFDCKAELHNVGPAANGPVAVTLGLGNWVSLYGSFAIFAGNAAAASIERFDADDTLALAAHFADASALLAATNAFDTGVAITLDAATGRSVGLLGVDKATFTTYVQAGHVTFA